MPSTRNACASTRRSTRTCRKPPRPPWSSSLREIESRIAAFAPRASRERSRSSSEPLQASLIALDPATGEVRAIVGGRDTASVGLNRALQSKRQPGSAFKPFVYAAAIENGYSPASVIDRLE